MSGNTSIGGFSLVRVIFVAAFLSSTLLAVFAIMWGSDFCSMRYPEPVGRLSVRELIITSNTRMGCGAYLALFIATNALLSIVGLSVIVIKGASELFRRLRRRDFSKSDRQEG
jgi:hypothetical protein